MRPVNGHLPAATSQMHMIFGDTCDCVYVRKEQAVSCWWKSNKRQQQMREDRTNECDNFFRGSQINLKQWQMKEIILEQFNHDTSLRQAIQTT